ncbi:MAG: PEP-CTERM sorting domain-containing protein [Verrucomicrobiota bacterium]
MPAKPLIDQPKGTHALGVTIALAAGASLPSKADAVVIVNNDAASTTNAAYINIRFDHISGSISVMETGCVPGLYGWILFQSNTTFELLNLNSYTSASYYVLNKTYPAAPANIAFNPPVPPIDLANPIPQGTGYTLNWSGGFLVTGTLPPVSERFVVGLRKQVGGDNYYGWSEFEVGSLNHIRTAFETQANTGITLGQIPEPSSAALLLTAGLAGVATFRRRRTSESAKAWLQSDSD